MKIGDKIKYGKVSGEILSIMGETTMIKLQDGKQYAVATNLLTIVDEAVSAPSDMAGAMEAIKPFIKNQAFLGEVAKMMGTSGINELHIKAGAIQAFRATETLEERIARATAEATVKAEKEAREAWVKEHGNPALVQ